MKKYFWLLGTIFLLFMSPSIEARALEDAACLWVCDEILVWGGEVQKTQVSDGNGGTATYIAEANTLILDNFCPKNLNESVIDASFMGGDFQIIVRGVNNLSTTGDFSIYITDGFIISGPGKLITNAGIIGMQKRECKLIIENCELDITSPSGGIYCGTLEVRNADITVKCTAQIERYFGIAARALLVQDANLTVSIVPDEQTSFLVGRDKDDGTALPESEQIILLGNEKITDEKGNLLHAEEYFWYSSWWYVFTSKTHNEYLQDKEGSIARTVRIVSEKRTAFTSKVKETISLIDSIGTVTENSRDDIMKAKGLYFTLSDEQKQMVYNYAILVEAEKSYDAINQAAADKVINLISQIGEVTIESREIIELAEEEYAKLTNDQKEKVTNYNILINAKAKYEEISNEKLVRQKHKVINKEPVSVKKAVIKKVSSKKKKTATITWKVDKNCSGYQIQYSTNHKFKKNKISKYVNSNKKKSLTIKKLKSKKKYYFRIREYKIVDGTKYFGSWSSVKKCYIK